MIAANPNFRSGEGHLLYARTLEAAGDFNGALHEYEALVPDSVGEEGRVRHAQLLRRTGEHAKGTALLEEVLKRASLAPKYYQREQRAWIDIARRELQGRG